MSSKPTLPSYGNLSGILSAICDLIGRPVDAVKHPGQAKAAEEYRVVLEWLARWRKAERKKDGK